MWAAWRLAPAAVCNVCALHSTCEARIVAAVALAPPTGRTDLGSSHLKKADTGKLEVVFGKRNMVAGYPHWTIAADKGPEHLVRTPRHG